GWRRILFQLVLERKHPGNKPFGPGFIYFALEVVNIVLGEVCETPLLEQVVAHRLARNLARGNLLRPAGEAEHAVFYFIQWPHTGINREFAHFVREVRIVIPALGARIERVDESRAADAQRFTDGVHRGETVGHANRRNVFALRMTGRHHGRRILLPAAMHDALDTSGGAERGIGAPWRAAGKLNVSVGVRLVVVHENQAVVVRMGQGRGNRAYAHVRAAAVAAEGNHVDWLFLHLAFAHQRLQRSSRTKRGRAAAAELRV